MVIGRSLACALSWAVAGIPLTASAQEASSPKPLVTAQQDALRALAPFNGLWRGTGWALVNGERVDQVVTLRVGYALDDVTQFTEIRIYRPDGALSFHALNNVAFDPERDTWVNQARAEGRFGDFPYRPTPDGYVWELGGGGGGLRYSGTLRDGAWVEVTERLSPGEEPVTISQFTVRRIGETAWPAGGAMQAE
jgi:hypothetical protein